MLAVPDLKLKVPKLNRSKKKRKLNSVVPSDSAETVPLDSEEDEYLSGRKPKRGERKPRKRVHKTKLGDSGEYQLMRDNGDDSNLGESSKPSLKKRKWNWLFLPKRNFFESSMKATLLVFLIAVTGTYFFHFVIPFEQG